MLNIKKINYDENFDYGCETCDYGSSYVNEIEIIFENGVYANIKVDKMYDYALSEKDYMNLISNSNTIEEFCINIINLIKNRRYDKNINWLIGLQGLNITVNGEDINIHKTLEKNRLIKE